jgi:hypothetical protein
MAKGKTDYSEYLNVNVEDIEEPLPPPTGHYSGTIKSFRTRDIDYNSGDGPLPHLTMDIQLGGPLDDVDTDAMPKGGVKGKLVSKDYRLDNGEGQSQIRKLAEKELGLAVQGLQLSDLIREHLPKQEVIVQMDQREGKGEREGQFFPIVKKILSPNHEVG